MFPINEDFLKSPLWFWRRSMNDFFPFVSSSSKLPSFRDWSSSGMGQHKGCYHLSFFILFLAIGWGVKIYPLDLKKIKMWRPLLYPHFSPHPPVLSLALPWTTYFDHKDYKHPFFYFGCPPNWTTWWPNEQTLVIISLPCPFPWKCWLAQIKVKLNLKTLLWVVIKIQDS